MDSTDFVDKALARRLEAAEEMPQVHYGMLYRELRPEIGAAVEPICGGHMIFAGVGSPIGRTTASLPCLGRERCRSFAGAGCKRRCSVSACKWPPKPVANTRWW